MYSIISLLQRSSSENEVKISYNNKNRVWLNRNVPLLAYPLRKCSQMWKALQRIIDYQVKKVILFFLDVSLVSLMYQNKQTNKLQENMSSAN